MKRIHDLPYWKGQIEKRRERRREEDRRRFARVMASLPPWERKLLYWRFMFFVTVTRLRRRLGL